MKFSSALLSATSFFSVSDIAIYAMNDDHDVSLRGSSDSVSITSVNNNGLHFKSEKLNDYKILTKTDSIAIADFDNDGLMDIVMGKSKLWYGSNVVLFNKGHNLHFKQVQLPKLIPRGVPGAQNECASSFAIADFNNDGLMDIAASPSSTAGGKLYLNQGNGNFDVSYLPCHKEGICGGFLSVFAADLNNDGLVDIVTSDYDFVVLWNQGNGQFTPQRIPSQNNDLDFFTTNAPATIGDVNNDGFPDMVFSTGGDFDGRGSYQTKIQLMMNNGDGTFKEAVDLPGGYPDDVVPNVAVAKSMTLADIDNDGMLDIVAGYAGRENKSQVLMNNGDGTFGDVYYLPKQEDYYDNGVLHVGDLNNDGFVDILAHKQVLLNNGDGTFAYPVDFKYPDSVFSLYIGDLSNDGNADIIFGRHGATVVYINEGKKGMNLKVAKVE